MKRLLVLLVVGVLLAVALADSNQGTGRTGTRVPVSQPGSNCDPNYVGACLNPYSPDYDCRGGEGNGPDYTGEVTVVGEDHFGLDRNSDGAGCEWR